MTNHTDLLRRVLDVLDDCYDYVHDCYENVQDIEEAANETLDCLDSIRKLKTYLRTAIETGGWLPIETAPKDGTQILTVCGNSCSVREWGEGEDDIFAWQPRIRGHFPTHWMPLPPPPNSPNRESE